MAHTARAAAGPTNDGPTKENAVEAEKELGQAMRTNDAEGFCRLLDQDWAVVNGIGGLGDGVGVRDSVCAAIKAGTFTRKTHDMDMIRRIRMEERCANGQSASLQLSPGKWRCLFLADNDDAGAISFFRKRSGADSPVTLFL